MDKKCLVHLMRPGQIIDEVPTLIDRLGVSFAQFLAGPEDRAHGDGVKAVGVEHGGLIVIPQNRQFGFLHHEF